MRRDRGRGGRRHAGLCRPLRPRRIRRRAGAGRAAAHRAARLLCRHGGAGRRAADLCAAGKADRRSTGRTRSASMAGWSAAGGSPGRRMRDEDEPPDWLVFGAMIRTVSMGEGEPGLQPAGVGARGGRLRRPRRRRAGRELRAASDGAHRRLAGVRLRARSRRNICSACRARSGVRRDIDENGDLLVRRMGKVEVERRKLHAGARRAVLARSEDARAAHVKLLRTIRLDPSDTFVFERAAEPGEWAVSGAFVFWNDDAGAARRQGARRRSAAAFSASSRSAGRRWCRSSRRARRTAPRWSSAGAAAGRRIRRARSSRRRAPPPRRRSRSPRRSAITRPTR